MSFLKDVLGSNFSKMFKDSFIKEFILVIIGLMAIRQETLI